MNNHHFLRNISHKKIVLFTAIFCFVLMFGNTNNLFAQVFDTCPIISFTVQGQQRGKEVADKCVMALHENGNITVYILKKEANSCDYLDYAYFSNDDNIYAKYQFINRNRDFEPEYTLFPEIIISGVGITGGEIRCKLRTYISQQHGSLMSFNLYNEGADDYILSQIVFFLPAPGSGLVFSVEYN